MMEMLKIARSIYGDSTNRDNFIDSAGYAALAGMLQIPDRPFNPDRHNEASNEATVQE
jgi:hypothetical protein